jgi:hypothetical protein
MRLLVRNDLDLSRVGPQFRKFRVAIERDDLRSADLKKLAPTPWYRARLDYTNRLLVQFAHKEGELVCLVLEVILNHAYERSRLLRGVMAGEHGAAVDWQRFDPPEVATAPAVVPPPAPALELLRQEALALSYLHPERAEFHLLDKVLSFDDVQQRLFETPAPLILVGSAGSGKTALTLERLRQAHGTVLYVTQSSYLAQNARSLYGAHGYENPHQEAEFLSYREFVQTLQVPPGREVSFAAFRDWVQRHRNTLRTALGDSAAHADAHALFEEFRGVITGAPGGALSRAAYLALGVRQSLLGAAQREAAFDLFEKYREWLQDTGQYDPNLVAHAWLAHAQPVYDFMVVDEVQDLTPVQLALILKTLRKPGQFLLCGDSNQIVHPNFFSWSALRALFWTDPALVGDAVARQAAQSCGVGTDDSVDSSGFGAAGVAVLQANFRNSTEVTRLANLLLKIKHARFGSVDRESNFLVQATGARQGQVYLLSDQSAVRRELNTKTRTSTQFAVIVLRDEDKVQARQDFQTPLVFSVHEAKGLEYPNIILLNLVSGQRQAFAEICAGVRPEDLQTDSLQFRRARDKADKSLEIYKFYVNALYVALTRAVDSVYLLEQDGGHPLISLFNLTAAATTGGLAAQTSSRDAWALEARKLEQQGKQEQAQAIRDQFLKLPTPPWPVWNEAWLADTHAKAFDPVRLAMKARQSLFEYALWHDQSNHVQELAGKAGFAPARHMEFVQAGTRPWCPANPDDPKEVQAALAAYARTQTAQAVNALRTRHVQPYAGKNFKDILRHCDQYGADHRTLFNTTPLMMAAQAGNLPLIDALLERGADPDLRDHYGHTAWDHALVRFSRDAHYAGHAMEGVYARLAPQTIDVQTGGRLVRIERHQAEYWLLALMLANFKSLASELHHHCYPFNRPRRGFFADLLLHNVEYLPEHLWRPERRKRSALNAVLARAEVHSDYRPSRQLWRRITTGYYLPNPAMQLKVRVPQDASHPESWAWKPVYDVLALNLVDAGTRPGYYSHPDLGLEGGVSFRTALGLGST